MNAPCQLVPLSDAIEPALREIVTQSFQFTSWEVYRDRVGPENFRALLRGGEVVGGLAMYPMGQWFGGQSLPMAGFAAVGIAPEHRGTGVARELMARALRQLHDARIPLSALYASTQVLYRKVGFEQAGTRVRHAVSTRRIEVSDRAMPMRAVDPRQHEVLHELYRLRAARSSGHLDRNRAIWERAVMPPDEVARAYLIGPEAAPEGYVVFTQTRKKNNHYDLAVRDHVVTTPAAARRLWTFFADHRSIADEVAWSGPANDPLLGLLPEQSARVESAERWLLRLVDVPRALSLRGYPADVVAELHLEVTDALFPENAGRRVLHVAGGKGEVRQGGNGDLRLDVRGLASLFSGFVSPADLAMTGFVEGAEATLDVARLVFAGPEPWMPDFF